MKCLMFFCLSLIIIALNSKYVEAQTECTNDYGGDRYKGLCKPVDECTGAALKGNCLNLLVCCIPDRASSNVPENSFIKKNMFLKLAGNTKRNFELYNYFAQSLIDSDIVNQYKAGNSFK